MKNLITYTLIYAIISTFYSCSKSDDSSDDPAPTNPPVTSTITIKGNLNIAGQANTFYYNLYDADGAQGYSFTDFNSVKTKVDLVYYYDETGTETFTLSSPNNTKLSSLSNYSGYMSPSQVAAANNTLIKKLTGFSTTDFDNISDSAAIRTAYNSVAATSNRATSLAIGSIVAFKCNTGKLGIIKVTDIYPHAPATTSTSVVCTLKFQK